MHQKFSQQVGMETTSLHADPQEIQSTLYHVVPEVNCTTVQSPSAIHLKSR